MSAHMMSDSEYADLLRLILLETDGASVQQELALHAPKRIHWMREWSMILGYVETTGIITTSASPNGFSFPTPRLTERGRAKLQQIERLQSRIGSGSWD